MNLLSEILASVEEAKNKQIVGETPKHLSDRATNLLFKKGIFYGLTEGQKKEIRDFIRREILRSKKNRVAA